MKEYSKEYQLRIEKEFNDYARNQAKREKIVFLKLLLTALGLIGIGFVIALILCK